MLKRYLPQFITVRKMISNAIRNDLELCKQYANKQAVQERNFQGNLVIGIGSGSTVVYAVQYIVEAIHAVNMKAEKEGLKSDLNVVCIPSSFQAKQLIQENNLTLGSLDSYSEIDWTIDGADEVDLDNNLIKGGGGCLTQEKILASCSKEFYIVADYSKLSDRIGTVWKKGIPVEVIPISYRNVKNKLESILGGEANLRMAVAKAGPVITDNGNFILDWQFPENTGNWKQTELTIKMIPGVVEVGLFLNMATKIYIGMSNGEVKILK